MLAQRLPRRCKGTPPAQIAAKEPDGSVRLTENPDDVDFPVIGVSTLVGTLVGVLGGLIGLIGGAAAGALIGFLVELERADVTDEFVSDVTTALTPGKVAVVADISAGSQGPGPTSQGR